MIFIGVVLVWTSIRWIFYFKLDSIKFEEFAQFEIRYDMYWQGVEKQFLLE